ncbi:MAG: hypothetical protein FJY75_00515 [Candidatus Eisenbacteria bacterium]|uniref:Lipoprotein n=1 Tax=Eiseniibacteriota bacterium TaxID=2212470 RepID=A0A937X677_UNCEI|nr:hypothetical protein [Candidatus Eisenbacteria bacterium]
MTSGTFRRLWSRRSARGAAAAGLVLLLAAAGCLFQPRTPEKPGDGPQIVWVPPVTLGNALGNMKRALESKQFFNYGRSFDAGGFEMVLDQGDEAELGQNEFEEWSASAEEQRMAGILASTAATVTVHWAPRDSIQESADVRWYDDLSYRLSFRGPLGAVEYSGLVDLYFRDDGTGQWYIIRWEDRRDGSSNRTWGWLRARNAVEF